MKSLNVFYFFKKIMIFCLIFIVGMGSALPSYATSLSIPHSFAVTSLSEPFMPLILKGIKLDAKNPLQFYFILDRGQELLIDSDLKTESERLIKYFLASVTVPEEDLWVNLSPYEQDRIAPEVFAQTEMGRDLLQQDYWLKQIVASLLYPEGEEGKFFWQKVYATIAQRYGILDIPIDIFNKVWIVPEKAIVYESEGSAYIVESRLKVMMESDYLAISHHQSSSGEEAWDEIQTLTKEVFQEVIVPTLEKEINEGKSFALLRQIYHSLILAVWYKEKLKASLWGKTYINKNKIAGIEISHKQAKEKIWAEYLEIFKQGSYSYINEELDPISHELVVKKYFSGGFGFDHIKDAYQKTKFLPDAGNKDMVIQCVLDQASLVDLVANSADRLDQKQIIEGRARLKELVLAHPEQASYLQILSDSLEYIHTRKKTHVINVVENAYRLIRFSEEDIEFFFSRLKEVQDNGGAWSLEERAHRLQAYHQELQKVRDIYDQLPQEYQKLLVPLAIFHDIGALSPLGDLRWRGQGVLDLDQEPEARDWVHNAIGAGIVLKLTDIPQEEAHLLSALIFHHGAIANVGIDFFKNDILVKFNQSLQDLLLIFSILDMSGRQEGTNAANADLIHFFLENAKSFPQQSDIDFVETRISKAFFVSHIDSTTRSQWLSTVQSYFSSSEDYQHFLQNWQRVRMYQFDLFVRLARKSPQAYAELLVQISKELSYHLNPQDEVFMDTDIDFLALPFGEGRDQQRGALTEVVYNRVLSGDPIFFEIKEKQALDFHLVDSNNPLNFEVSEKKAYVFEIQLKAMQEEAEKQFKDYSENTGGIDFAFDQMKLQTLEGQDSFQLEYDWEANTKIQEFQGLMPHILSIHPMTESLNQFLGV